MKMSVSTIMLVLSLEVLVVAGLLSAAAATAADVEAIRLPSRGEDPCLAVVNGDGKRPWKCCDLPQCTRSLPPTCRCLDKVEQCASACKQCEPASSDPSYFVCNEQYHGDPGPSCTKSGDDDVPSGYADQAMGATMGATKDNADEKRPWECCDVTICTRSFPPICWCMDTVKHCASTCKQCEKVQGGHICRDTYKGFDQGPKCTNNADAIRRCN